jgi:hypothetical protein
MRGGRGRGEDESLEELIEVSGFSPNKFMKMRILLNRLIELSPTQRTDENLKMKAFTIWAVKFPLQQKCDELGKQLQERLSSLTIMKDSYLRDIVRLVLTVLF